MTETDPIASATLARLYLTQGHTTRAKAILDEVLGRDPFDGDALALRGRLVPGRPRLSATVEADGVLSLRWQSLVDAGRYHLVVSLWDARAAVPRQWVTSRACTSAFGRHRFSCPWPRGILVASIGRVDEDGYAPKIVAEPLGWG